MEANLKIKVSVLSEKDSWILFRQKAGTVADYKVARDILNECQCLPLAITTLGLALRNKKESVCVDALQQLQKSNFKGMSPVFSSIKLSFNFLESESVKICFLFCCLFPEDHKIPLVLLMSYVMGEKLLEDVDTYEEATYRLNSIVDKLTSSGLLLKDEHGIIVIHDVVRDVAISIATQEHGLIVKAGRNLREWPDMELGNCRRLSMIGNLLQCLPTTQIQAPHLQALFLNKNYWLTELPSDLFSDMKCLVTLDLSETRIESLPPSLSCLQNLRTLLLNHTSLKNLFPVDKLESLEVLSLCGSTNILDFPEEIRRLMNLRVLDLTESAFIRNISPNQISPLHRLEAFNLLTSNVYCIPEHRETEFFQEVGSLSRLTSLEFFFHNPGLCHIEIPGPWEKLTRFQIMYQEIRFMANGPRRSTISQERGSQFLRNLCLEIQEKQVANWARVLLGRTYYLQLDWCWELESVTELGAKGMNDNLKFLSLYDCPKMECIVSNMRLVGSEEYAFSDLKILEIERMDAFVEICKGTPPPRLLQELKILSFDDCNSLVTVVPNKLIEYLVNLEGLSVSHCYNLLYILQTEEEESGVSRISEPLRLPILPNLKTLEMRHCIRIRYVFTMRVARYLLLLEELQINGCEEMEVIFKYIDGEDIKCNDSAILPRLKMLTIEDAAELESFTTRNLSMELSSLEFLEVSKCENLKRLPFGTTSVLNVHKFDMEQKLFNKLEWEDESVKSRLQAILEVGDIFV